MEDYWKPLILQLRRSTLRFRFASATLKGLLRPAVWSGLAAGSGRERTHLTQNNKTTPHELPRPAQSNGQHVLHFAVPRLHGFSELARAVIFLGLRLQIFSFRIAPMQPGPGSVHMSECCSRSSSAKSIASLHFCQVHLSSAFPLMPRSELRTSIRPSAHPYTCTALSCSRAVAAGSETPSFESSCHSKACGAEAQQRLSSTARAVPRCARLVPRPASTRGTGGTETTTRLSRCLLKGVVQNFFKLLDANLALLHRNS